MSGEVGIDGEGFPAGTMVVFRGGATPRLRANAAARVALVGGAPLAGRRHLWWNFVSSSKERIEQAKADWKSGRFDAVPGDSEFIPLPER